MSKTPTGQRGARPVPPKQVLAALAALLFAVAAWAGWLVPEPAPQISTPSTPAVEISPAIAAGGATTVVVAPKVQVDAAAEGLDDHVDARHGPSEPDAKPILDAQAKVDGLPVHPPDAAPSQRGCTSKFHLRSHSSRNGLAPSEILLHETVSRNVAGWSDVAGIWSFFDRLATGASATYIVDREGHCIYAVREVDKPWTQAGANRFSIGIEVVNSASRAYDRNYIDGPGLSKLATIVSDAAKRWGIPLQVGKVVNCVPVRKGILTHAMLGACGGGHVDIAPFPEGLGQVITAAKKVRAGSSKQAAARGRTCNQLRYHRVKARAAGWTPERVARVKVLKDRAKSQGLDASKCRA